MAEDQYSGLKCLQLLFSQVRRGVNFAALITQEIQEKYNENPCDALIQLSEGQKLRPARITSLEEIGEYAGPALLKVRECFWVLVLNTKTMKGPRAQVVDPTVGNKVIEVNTEEIERLFSKEALIFHNLAQVDAAKQSKLTAFVSIARHHNVPADIREIMHEYAVGEEEVSDRLFTKIAKDKDFKTKTIKLSPEKLEKSESIFPCIAIKRNGKFAVLCGILPAEVEEDESVEVAAIPTPEPKKALEEGEKAEETTQENAAQENAAQESSAEPAEKKPCEAEQVAYSEKSKEAPAAAEEEKEPAEPKIVMQRAMVDPESPKFNTADHFIFLSPEEFDKEYTGKFILLKKTFKLTDENQPFSLSWFIPEFLKQKAIFGEIALMVVLLTIFSLITPLFFQVVVDKVLVNQAYNTLNVLGIGILIVVVFNSIVSFVRSYLLLFATNKIDISTATKTFSHLMHLPLDFFERISSGVLLKHMQQTEKIRGFLSGNLFFTLLDIFSLCLFFPFLLFYSGKLTMVVLAFSAGMALVIASLIKPFQRRLDKLYQAEGKRQSMLVEAIHGVKTVKALALEPVERKEWDNSTAVAIKSYFRVGQISMTAQSISHALEMSMTICVIWIGAYMVFNHTITMGALIAFQMLAGRVTSPLVRMVGLIHEYQQIALSVRMLGVVMNTPQEPAGGGVRNPLKGDIAFENISFRYRMDLPMAITNFDLHLTPGTTVGFVGRSGSGKTTVTKLLQGLYPVTQGIIKLDGIDLREIDKTHLRRNIGVVLQDNYFFSGTVRQNISLPKQNATLEEIIYASKLAGADEFVQKLPRGYDTMLEENACNLSGGQKQRLAIARALLTNPPILIFDEATSALDPESEEVIRKNLKAIARGRTVIIVSHRLSIVSHADTIVVIDKGEIAAQGTHKELLAQEGIYKDFWTQQMSGGNEI